jgi:chromosome segregation protein
MLYLDSLVLHNFKSFRHASIKFKPNFNCIVGPNGSGKSNICDALLFVLGESSLKRMRITSMQQLINDKAKPKNDEGTKRAYVKLNLAGDEPVEIARIIKSNNKIGYRLNGKRVTRQEMLEVIRGHRSEISEVNTITQGEIMTLLALNPRERRGLIEVAAGIREFDEKKAASMSELDKVQAKIGEAGVLLNERLGFLGELAKEKEDAERYISLTNTIKRINYTLLRLREDSAASDLSRVTAVLHEGEGKHSALSEKVNKATAETEALLAKKAELSKRLNERSMEVSATNRLLEGVGKEIAVAETQRASSKSRHDELDARIAELQSNKKKLSEQVASNEPALKALRDELADVSKQLEGKDIRSAVGEFELISKQASNQHSIDALAEKQNALSNAMLQSKLGIEASERGAAEAQSAMEEKHKCIDSINGELSAKKGRLAELRGKVSGMKEQLAKHSADASAILGTQDKLYAESVDVRERIAMFGARTDRSAEVLKKAMKGFYGRAYELCSYDAKYASAVNAAASGRFSYFVVDSIDVAKEAIAILKSKQLGRATFIPIKEVVSSQQQRDRGLVPIIEHVSFDKKYERVFAYIFANTYLVDSLDDAKQRIGGHRFVTIDGELVETSGVVTGGSSESLQSPAVLSAKLKGMDEKRAALNAELSEITKLQEQVSRSIAACEAEALSIGMEMRYSEESVGKLSREITELESAVASKLKEKDRLRASAEASSSELGAITRSIETLKRENERILSLANSPERRNAKMGKADIDAIKALQSRSEKLTGDIAATSKESELLNVRIGEVDADIKKSVEERKALEKAIAVLDGSITESKKQQEELQQKIRGHDAKSASLYKEVEEVDSGIAKLSQEKGRLSSELERLSRDSMELQARSSQLQTRIADIKAELMSYQGVDMMDERATDKLEAQIAISKSEVEKLGAVNLKATELYLQKSRDAEEAKQKLGILENDKNSITAMINEIEAKKLNVFMETLNVVNENFRKLYGYVSDDQANLYLENARDPFNTGLMIRLTSKIRANNSDLMSGGEKALLMLMLIFAIHMRSPRSFYIFDEIDTMLDKENSKKLSKLLSELSKKSQMVVVSHNDSLITAADTAIGVVRRDGESQVVGLQLTEASTIKSG